MDREIGRPPESGEQIVWEHFKLNADQRMKSLHFFLIAAIFINGGAINALQNDFDPTALLFLGFLQIILAVVFWIADQRIKFLLQISVAAMLEIEAKFPPAAQLFRMDKEGRIEFFRITWAIRILFISQALFGVYLVHWFICRSP